MTLIHVQRIEDPFVRFKKSIVYDSRLSFKAKGILSYAFSRPENWSFYKSEMLQHTSDGKDSLNSGIKELKKFGYLHMQSKQDPETGIFSGQEWFFFEEPIDEDTFKKFIRSRGNPSDGKPVVRKTRQTENPPLIRKIDTKNDSKENDIKEITNVISKSSPDGSQCSANAERECDIPTSIDKEKKPKIKKTSAKISEKTRDFYDRFITTIKIYKHNYVIKSELNILNAIEDMFKEGRTEDEIIQVLEFALKDDTGSGTWTGWKSKVLCANPARYLCERFDMIQSQSTVKQGYTVNKSRISPHTDDKQSKIYNNLF